MASGFELNEEANKARVLAGMKGGDLFQNPVTLPPLQFGEGIKPEVSAAQTAGPRTPTQRVEDPWYSRRNK